MVPATLPGRAMCRMRAPRVVLAMRAAAATLARNVPSRSSQMPFRFAVGAAVAAAMLTLPAAAHAQAAWPTRPITLVVPYPAGGAADVLCRFGGEKATGARGQNVVVEERPGGCGGLIGI